MTEIYKLADYLPPPDAYVVFVGSRAGSDGPVSTGEVLQKYRAMYGAGHGEKWRYATEEERSAYLAEMERVRILCERFVVEHGETPFRATIDELQRANPDLDPADVEVVIKLAPGESVTFGGGAAPTWTVRRP